MQRQTSPLRILQVVTDTDRRGAQVFACDLGAQLATLGQEVHTVALTPGATQSLLDLPTLGATSRGISTLRALRAEMKKADITVAHGSSTLVACALAGVGVKQPWVYRQISDSRFWAPSIWRRLRVAAALRLAQHVVALSSGAANTLHDYLWLPSPRISVVPNGVPAARHEPPSPAFQSAARQRFGAQEDEVVALYIGALVPEKGVDIAIGAVGQVLAARLIVVGEGPQRAELEHMARQVAPGKVTFVGGLDDVRPAYAAADVVILASRGGDSMPAVLIEAGLHGVAAITCPVGEITDVVRNGETGLVVPINDQAAVASALAQLATHPNETARLGRAARQDCLQRFTIEVVAGEWLSVLRRSRLEA